MATGSRKDPAANFHFYVDIENVFQGTFREVSGLGTGENPVIEHWAAGKGGETLYTKQPGRIKYPDLTFKAGLGEDTLKLYKWREKVELGKVGEARTNGTIWMFSQDNTPVAKWKFEAAWPMKISGPSLNANANDAAVEDLTVAVEKITREM
ncbi:MAG: phage tail protein [Chloroflexota bacterium]